MRNWLSQVKLDKKTIVVVILREEKKTEGTRGALQGAYELGSHRAGWLVLCSNFSGQDLCYLPWSKELDKPEAKVLEKIEHSKWAAPIVDMPIRGMERSDFVGIVRLRLTWTWISPP